MLVLILGLGLWVGMHFFQRMAPGARTRLEARLGGAAKGVVAVLLMISVVLIVIGYRAAPFVAVYEPPEWGVHANNLLMYVAILLLGLGSSKSPLRSRLRHPMLLGFALWAALHLLVNGDLASVVMFGTLLVWALVEIPIINRAEPRYVPYQGGSRAGTIRLAVIALVLYVLITTVHAWLGVWPFPR